MTVREGSSPPLLVQAKARVKSWLARWRAAYIRQFFSFTNDDLLAALRRLGIERDDVLIAHTSFAQFEGFQGGVADAIRTLQAAVEDGTLLIPTLPFDGAAVDYIKSGTVTDIARTPSRMGFITEVFRRLPGVTRSIHPTHPIAIWGKDAAAVAAGHHAAATPCGVGTPFHQLLQRQGKILLAGVSIRTMTFYHCVEELLEPEMPFSPFTDTWYEASSKGPDGTVYATRMRLFDPGVSARRDPELMVEPLKRRGFWRQTRVGRLDLVVLHATEVVATVREMAAERKFCYRDH
jgi:aminoglycoside 3-N-acetyltransferase